MWLPHVSNVFPASSSATLGNKKMMGGGRIVLVVLVTMHVLSSPGQGECRQEGAKWQLYFSNYELNPSGKFSLAHEITAVYF